jgi:serine/threonine protein kinase
MPTSHPSADRNLLLGILALQMDFVTRDALVAGMHAWVLRKSTSLGQILLEQGALRADTHTLLEALVEKHLEMHDGNAHKSLAAVSSVGSLRDDLKQMADPDLCASLVHVSAAHVDEGVPATRPPAAGQNEEAEPPATRPPSVGTPTSSGLRFRILRPHARGGLGEVFVARDEELHREVALKEIQDRHADHADSRTRFVREAEITGGLEHPGIVPVYGLGHYADGRPYYAMRFIRGDSLQQAIESFHRADVPGRDPGERALSLRQLLGRFVDVCNAIAYAHSRGVLHRDLKPGNIMLGQYGETLVVDWGLAKAGGETSEAPASAEGPLRPASGSSSAPTQMGTAVGTPHFMSPEQAAGRLDLLGPASDVYSLGATLYCLLTGNVPFEAADLGALLHWVQKGEFPPPRQVKRQVPAPLEAVCLKAMALRQEDRYTSARALADDVEHWLADEPVSAWREPCVMRATRWVRRHRVLAASTAAALLVALVLGSAGAVWWQQLKKQERLARTAQQERAGQRAKELIEQAVQMRKRMRWAEAKLLLTQARDAANEADDEALAEQLQQAKADLALALSLDRVREEGNVPVDGKWNPTRVRDRYPQVFRKHGLAVLSQSVETLAERIRTSAVRDEILAALDDWTANEELGQQRRLLELTWRIDPENRWRQQLLEPGTLRNPQRRRALLGQIEEENLAPATVVFLSTLLGVRTPEGQKLLKRARERHPDDFWLNFTLGNALMVPTEARDRNEQEEAIGYYRTALAVKPGSSVARNNLGGTLKAKGDVEGAIHSYKEAIRLDPKLAWTHNNLGNALKAKGDMEGAIHSYKEAIRLDPGYAWAHNNLGVVLLRRKEVEGAIRCFREALRLDPSNAVARFNLAWALFGRAMSDK